MKSGETDCAGRFPDSARCIRALAARVGTPGTQHFKRLRPIESVHKPQQRSAEQFAVRLDADDRRSDSPRHPCGARHGCSALSRSTASTKASSAACAWGLRLPPIPAQQNSTPLADPIRHPQVNRANEGMDRGLGSWAGGCRRSRRSSWPPVQADHWRTGRLQVRGAPDSRSA